MDSKETDRQIRWKNSMRVRARARTHTHKNAHATRHTGDGYAEENYLCDELDFEYCQNLLFMLINYVMY